MCRKNRLKLASDGATYHVMTRIVLGERLLEEATIREWIYQRILQLADCFFVDLHAIAVMSNHYHIVLSVRKPNLDPAEIERRFKRLKGYNKNPTQWSDEFPPLPWTSG